MKYQHIVILGAGAVGCYLVWGFSHKEDIRLTLSASGERKNRLEKDGLMINGKRYFPAVAEPETIHDADLLFVCVKGPALPCALNDIQSICRGTTDVISLMNGVTSESLIGNVVGNDHVIPSLIKISSERRNGEVHFDPDAAVGIFYGEENGKHTERMQSLAELFLGTGLHTQESKHILSEIWSKFRLNVSVNLPQAALACGIGAYRDSSHVAKLRDMLANEVNQLAEASGIDLSLADPASVTGGKAPDTARYSTLQDLDAARKTEIELFAGAVVDMCHEKGISAPVSETMLHLIAALEEKNAGLFDY